uniref:Uncharacterized protein n=1 Tax=Anguilla anguilla TaxID=7936 RepID=A0A0E9SLE7_ANGAN
MLWLCGQTSQSLIHVTGEKRTQSWERGLEINSYEQLVGSKQSLLKSNFSHCPLPEPALVYLTVRAVQANLLLDGSIFLCGSQGNTECTLHGGPILHTS